MKPVWHKRWYCEELFIFYTMTHNGVQNNTGHIFSFFAWSIPSNGDPTQYQNCLVYKTKQWAWKMLVGKVSVHIMDKKYNGNKNFLVSTTHLNIFFVFHRKKKLSHTSLKTTWINDARISLFLEDYPFKLMKCINIAMNHILQLITNIYLNVILTFQGIIQVDRSSHLPT